MDYQAYEKNQHLLVLLSQLRKKVQNNLKLLMSKLPQGDMVRMPTGGVFTRRVEKNEPRSITLIGLGKALENTFGKEEITAIIEACKEHLIKSPRRNDTVEKTEYLFRHPTDTAATIRAKSMGVREQDEHRCLDLLVQQLSSAPLVSLAGARKGKRTRTSIPMQ